MQPEPDYNEWEDFKPKCEEHGLSASLAEEVFERLSDKWCLVMALERIARLPNVQVNLFAEDIVYLSYMPRGTQKDAVGGVQTAAISVRELKARAEDIASHAKNLQQLIFDFEVPASEVATTVQKFAVSQQTIEQLRGSLTALETVQRIGQAWAAALDHLKDQKRTVSSPPRPVEQFVRRLARIWLRGGGEVVSTRDSEFAAFLEDCFKAVDWTAGGPSYRLSGISASETNRMT
jgi:hypothetical protein